MFFKKKLLSLLTALLMIFLLFPSGVLAEAFYVLPFNSNAVNGNGLSPDPASKLGSDGAWNGLENIDWGKINPGDKILLHRGLTYLGQIKVEKSGEPGKNITFSTFGEGSNPVITGGKELSRQKSDWQLESLEKRWVCTKFSDGSWSNGIYNAAIVDGGPLKRSYSSDFRHYYGEFANARFNVSVFPDNEPWNHKVYVATLPYNVLIEGKKYVEFDHIDFSLANGWSLPQYGSIHIVEQSQNITFTNCKISYGAYSGFWVDASDYISITDCEIVGNYCTGFYFRSGSSYAKLSGCKIYQNGKYLSVNNASDTGGLLMGSSGVGKGHLIEKNEIFDNAAETVVDRVDGSNPDGTIPWVKYSGNIWKKTLSSLKRWAGTSDNQGVWFLGIEEKSVPQAEKKELCNAVERWFWERSTETLFLYSEVDPNKFDSPIEIAWKNGSDPAISLWSITDAVVRENYIHDNYSSGIGVSYTTSANVVIENNRVENNLKNHSLLHYGNRYGVMVSGQGGFVISGNSIVNNGGTEMVGNPLWGGLVISCSSISPADNTVVEKNTIYGNGGYQLSWYRYLAGEVLSGAKSDYNKVSGSGPLFYYLGSSFETVKDYSSVSGMDLHSEVLVSQLDGPSNLRLK